MGSFALWDDTDGQKRAAEMILSQQLDGLITIEPAVLPDDLPFSVVTYYNRDLRFDGVIHDFPHALSSMFDYFLALGHRRIAHISGGLRDIRTISFMKNIQEKSLPWSPDWFFSGSFSGDNFALGYHGMRAILGASALPTALFAHDDQTALGAIRCAVEAGLKVPDDISVIGYDNIPASAYSIPSLSTFGQPENISCANLLWDCLLRRIRNPKAPRKEYLLKSVLIERESSSAVREKKESLP